MCIAKGDFDIYSNGSSCVTCDPSPLPYQLDREATFRKLPNTAGEIVFVGDSLIAEGLWSELFSTIRSRGIGGETTAGLLRRLDEVTESRPRKIFLLIGANSLAQDIPLNQIMREYRTILERIGSQSPATQVYVIGVLPVNQHFTKGPIQDNTTIREMNRRLRQLVATFARFEYLDVSDALVDDEGNLRKELTYDGLHLNLDAYLILGERLEKKVRGEEGLPTKPAGREAVEPRTRRPQREPNAG